MARSSILRIALLLPALVLGFALVSARAESKADDALAAVLSKYEADYREQVVAFRDKAFAQLGKKYVAALEAQRSRYAAAGDLDGVVALRDELARVKETGPNPVDGDRVPAPLVKLRAAYRQQVVAVQASLDKRTQAIARSIDREFATLVTEFTRKDELAAAVALRDARKRFKRDGIPFLNARPGTASATGNIRSGRLRSYCRVKPGSGYQEMITTAADRYDDFVQVAVLNGGRWAGVRLDGSVVSEDKRFHGKQDVADITKTAILYRDGRIETLEGRDREVRREGTFVLSTVRNNLALLKGGRVAAWGDVYKSSTYTSPPAGLEKVVALAALWGVDNRAYAVRSDGSVVSWGDVSVPSLLPDTVPDVVRLDAGWRHVAALTRDGRVRLWPKKFFGGVPADLPRIIDIKAHCAITAVQKEDLGWIAWGDKTMGVCDKINEIGPALDIAFEANGRGHGYLLWIEPRD